MRWDAPLDGVPLVAQAPVTETAPPRPRRRRAPSDGRRRSPEGALEPPEKAVVSSRYASSPSSPSRRSTSARCSAVSRVGTRTSTSTSRSPRRPVSSEGMPRPRTAWTAPGCVPGESSISSGPSGVGTETVLPSAASVIVTDVRTWRSSPSRSTPSSGRTPHGDVDVPGRAAQRARVPRAAHPDPLPVVDPGRHVELQRHVLERPAVALAALARRLDQAAGAVAARAGSRPHDLAEDRAGDLLDDSRAAAARAGDGRRAWRRAGAGAGLAAPRRAHAHAERDPAQRVRKVDLDLRADVGAARRTWPGVPPLPEERLAEERREDVGEAAEIRIHRREPSAAQPGMAEPVVGLPALGVREHLVRLGDGAEPELGVGLLAHVRVELACEPPEGAT